MRNSERDFLKIADRIAEKAHDGQRDHGGEPYIDHARRVASYVDQSDAYAIAAALLHDVIEDNADVTPESLLSAGIPVLVVDAVCLLDRHRHDPEDYYSNMLRDDAASKLARAVKLADLADNTDPARKSKLPARLRAHLRKKYARAYAELLSDPVDGYVKRAS